MTNNPSDSALLMDSARAFISAAQYDAAAASEKIRYLTLAIAKLGAVVRGAGPESQERLGLDWVTFAAQTHDDLLPFRIQVRRGPDSFLEDRELTRDEAVFLIRHLSRVFILPCSIADPDEPSHAYKTPGYSD